MKRSIAILLSAFVLSCALFSCVAKADKTPDFDDAAELFHLADYSGDSFTFLVIKHTETIADHYGGDFIDADTYTGETVNDRVYERNLAVEERYNIKIEELSATGNDPARIISSYRLAGDICFDAVYGWGYKLAPCIPEGAFLDLAQLETVDLSRDWWAPTAMSDLAIGDSIYIATNDITMNRLKWADVIIYNNTVAKETGIEDKYGSPLSLVTEGKWTYDVFLKMLSDSASTDRAGLITRDTCGVFLAHGSDIYYTKKTDSTASLSFYSDRLVTLMDAVYPVFGDAVRVKSTETLIAENDSDESEPRSYALSAFAGGGALFYVGDAHDAATVKDAGCDYSILPIPKFDEKQEGYNCTVSPLSSMFVVLSESRNDVESAGRDRTGIILDYMAYKSREILYPGYAEELLYTEKGCTRSGDREVLGIIRDSTRYEFSSLFGITDTHDLAKAMFTDPKNAEDIYQSKKAPIDEKLSEIYSSIPKDNEKKEQ